MKIDPLGLATLGIGGRVINWSDCCVELPQDPEVPDEAAAGPPGPGTGIRGADPSTSADVWLPMTRQRFTLGYALVAVGVGAGLLYLDAAGVFIYFGYVPAALLVLGVVLGGVFAAGKVDRLTRVDLLAFSVVTLGLVVIALACPFLPTSQRKAFYLDARSLRAGMSWEDVQHRMAAYPSFEKYAGSVTFLHKSSPNTVDAAVVRLTATSDGEQVASVEYSAD